jgi:hypothetical protein
MALTGHLSDLSLSELIEFFCNQRKSGRLKVLYPQGAGYFYLLAGSVVDARIGVLRGCDAVYYALTLPNAEFQFSVDAEAPGRTINQPWTQVVLEGLRRLDESISPGVAFPPDYVPESDELASEVSESESESSQVSAAPAFFGLGAAETQSNRKPLFIGAIAVAVVASVAAIGVPAGWYSKKPAPTVQSTTQQAPSQSNQQQQAATQPQPVPSESGSSSDDAAQAARRQREKDKEKKARDVKAAENTANVQTPPEAKGKKVVVTVTYDESGRVTQASGGDANALRIARQKRFPPGKGGSASVAIPIN